MIEDADVCLTVTVDNVASAWISIDGEHVFAPNHFSQKVTTLQVVKHFVAGPHTIVLSMRGKPEGTISLLLKGCITQPPQRRLCSEVAREHCEEVRGWQVVAIYGAEGTLYCTPDGRGPENNCDTCGVYGIYVWKDGAPEHFCPEDGTFIYTTRAGEIYSGHTPCICGNNVSYCGSWDMQDCIPD
jgi:hypothetical protein